MTEESREQILEARNTVIRELHDLHKISLVQMSDLYMSDVIHEETEPKLSLNKPIPLLEMV